MGRKTTKKTRKEEEKNEIDENEFEESLQGVCHLSAHTFMKHTMSLLNQHNIKYERVDDITMQPLELLQPMISKTGFYRILASAHGPKEYEDEFGETRIDKGTLHDFCIVVTETKKIFLVQTNVYQFYEEPKISVQTIQSDNLLSPKGLESIGLKILLACEDPTPFIYRASGFLPEAQ